MVNYRCEICGGVVLYEKSKGYFHVDRQQDNHLAFPVPVSWEGRAEDPEVAELAHEEDGPEGSLRT